MVSWVRAGIEETLPGVELKKEYLLVDAASEDVHTVPDKVAGVTLARLRVVPKGQHGAF